MRWVPPGLVTLELALTLRSVGLAKGMGKSTMKRKSLCRRCVHLSLSLLTLSLIDGNLTHKQQYILSTLRLALPSLSINGLDASPSLLRRRGSTDLFSSSSSATRLSMTDIAAVSLVSPVSFLYANPSTANFLFVSELYRHRTIRFVKRFFWYSLMSTTDFQYWATSGR